MLCIPSISGSGEVILRVFAFRARMSSIGAVFPELVISQRPVLRYAFRLSFHRCLSASGQRDGRQGRILASSMRGIIGFAYSRSSSRAAFTTSAFRSVAFAKILAVATPSSGTESALPTRTRAGLSPMLTLCWYIQDVPRIMS
uniref:Uncharacterized protein n=1 Tax=Mycena chlorophos TaxID=658473 RepID=A0ABQ0LCG2_MYCCL|nr:predicted protein [Mycena chlorophos]